MSRGMRALDAGGGIAHAFVMNLLFDSFDAASRTPEIDAAIVQLAGNEGGERGAVFTRPGVVAAILDLSGYHASAPLHRMRLLEPSFGGGDFLLAALDRLLEAWRREGRGPAYAGVDLAAAIRAVEVHRDSFDRVVVQVIRRLQDAGIALGDARALCAQWLVCDDFLLTRLEGEFDFVVGNPPYVRQERIPPILLGAYRSRYRTLYDRADLYVPFYERALDLLAPCGALGFICANRWLKNKYGGPLREKITGAFEFVYFLDMEGVDAFHSEVIAYPAITIIRRQSTNGSTPPPTRVAHPGAIARIGFPAMVSKLVQALPDHGFVSQIDLAESGGAPLLLDDIPRLALLRRLEHAWPTLEQAGCKVGIGVATGCDRVMIGDFDALPVEAERKLPLVMAGDLVAGQIRWAGKGVLNPFEPDGRLVALDDYPRFAAYLREHFDVLAKRHVALKNKVGWYRTIDRITPELTTKPKLLVPDIKGEAAFVFDEGHYYPHHNLYFITSAHWNLRALQAVLRSSLTLMIVATYCTRMAGGFLRFQAQYLRRIRLPRWEAVSDDLRSELAALAEVTDQDEIDAAVFRLYGLSDEECHDVQRIARAARVTNGSKRSAA